MTDAQTEARALPRRLEALAEHLTLQPLTHADSVDIATIREAATALVAKDAELAGALGASERFSVAWRDAERRAERTEAQLAEARKALEQRDTDIAEFMGRLGSRWFLEQGWFPKSVGAREDDARRALTGGKNG